MTKYSVLSDIPPEAREELKDYSDIVSHLLFHRGIKTKEEAGNFFNHSYEGSLHDPFLLKDMEKACERIEKAVKENQKICIYADYDADGIPGATILADFLEKIKYENYIVYIPHRNKEGFGLNLGAIAKIKEQLVDLIITIDCGIADEKEVDYINELGMDVIITDHHEANGKTPNAFAIVNPKQKTCQYPEKMLCGSAVIFKVVHALVLRGNFDITKGWEKTLLDMVAIATLSDMVPLSGENRSLAHFGMIMLKMSPRKGLHALFKKTRINQKQLNEDDIGFMISPRINAASRMGEPITAFKLLQTKDHIEAEEITQHLNEINNERKGHVAQIVKEAKKHIKEKEMRNIFALGNTKWQPSLLGLAANSLSEEFKGPVFLWGRGDGSEIKGSCRSTREHSIIDLLNEVSEEVVETFGGHHQAGGFVLKKDKVDFLYDELFKSFEKQKIVTEKELIIDKEISFDNLNNGFLNEINKLSPFGINNNKPTFKINAFIKKIDHFGKRKEHLKVLLEKDGKSVEAITFFKTKDDFEIKEGAIADAIVQIEKDLFKRGQPIRLRIIDILLPQ